MKRLGTGIGWRPEIADAVERMPGIDWVEAVAENICPGHVPESLLRLRERGVTVVPHGVSLGLGGADRPDRARLADLAARAEALGSPLVTEHIAFVRAGGPLTASPLLEAGHLLPVPRTRDALEILCENIRIAQDSLPVPLAVENIAALIGWPDGEMTEGQFLYELADRTGVRLLIDVANLHTNHVNRGEDPAGALDELPVEAMAYVHVAGGFERDGVWHDSHAHPVPRPVLDILADLASRATPPGVLLERDDNFPEPSELERELTAIRETVEKAGAKGRPPAARRTTTTKRSATAHPGSTALASNTGSTALTSNTGSTASASHPGSTALASNTDGTTSASNTGSTTSAAHPGGTALASNTSGTALVSNTGSTTPAAHPGGTALASNTDGTTSASNTSGTTSASHPGGTALASNTGTTSASNTGGSASASHPGGTALASNTGGTASASSTGGTAEGGCTSGGTGPARQRLALAQTALLSCLVAGTPVPEGFDRVRIGVQARSLAAKRAGVVAKVAPELPGILGEEYRPAFLAYAHGRPMAGGYRRDALDFAEHLLLAGRPGDAGARHRLREWWLERSGPKPPSRRPAARLARATRRVLLRH